MIGPSLGTETRDASGLGLASRPETSSQLRPQRQARTAPASNAIEAEEAVASRLITAIYIAPQKKNPTTASAADQIGQPCRLSRHRPSRFDPPPRLATRDQDAGKASPRQQQPRGFFGGEETGISSSAPPTPSIHDDELADCWQGAGAPDPLAGRLPQATGGPKKPNQRSRESICSAVPAPGPLLTDAGLSRAGAVYRL